MPKEVQRTAKPVDPNGSAGARALQELAAATVPTAAAYLELVQIRDGIKAAAQKGWSAVDIHAALVVGAKADGFAPPSLRQVREAVVGLVAVPRQAPRGRAVAGGAAGAARSESVGTTSRER